MKKTLSLTLAALLTASACTATACSNKLVDKGEIVIPTYTSDERVEFVAYGSPTTANNENAGNANCLTDEQYGYLAAAGFTEAEALFDGWRRGISNDYDQRLLDTMKAAEEDALIALNLAEKHGLKYCVRDWIFYGLASNATYKDDYQNVLDKMFSSSNPYVNMPAYAGNFLHDEPTIQQMDRIAEIYDVYKEKVPNGNAHINLLPDYASAEALDETGNSTYEDYIDHYIDLFKGKIDYISYDYYPLNKSQFSKSRIKETYLQNFELVANKAKENDLDFKIYIQAVSDYTGIRDIVGAQDFRFQIYTGMAFGVKSFTYYTYYDRKGNGSLIASDGSRTYRYYAAMTVNNEVHAWEQTYLNFNWEGVMTKLGDELVENIGFSLLQNPMQSHSRIKDWSVTEDTVCGVFKDGDGRDGFMFVNYTDPYFYKTDTVTVKFDNARAALTYRLGQKVIVPLKNGEYTFKLYPGEGRFIIPLV